MDRYGTYILILSMLLFALLAGGIYCVFMRACESRDSGYALGVQQGGTPAPLRATSSVGRVDCPPGMPDCIPAPLSVSIDPSSAPIATRPILAAGRGTTTVSPQTPYNDVLIAETGSKFASLRNARYNTWPYPGEIRFKEIYLLLPDAYTPIFPGYSNEQFVVSSDGTKQVKLYLRQQGSTAVGADVEVYVQSPIETDEDDHPLTKIDSSDAGATYSLVKNKEEVIVEVTYHPVPSVSQDAVNAARAALLRAVEKMELEW